MKASLVIPIANCPLTGRKRQARLLAFQILTDLNMVNNIQVEYVTDTGEPLIEQINADPALSDYQKQVARQQFADQHVARQTRGSFVDPATGQLTDEAAPGAVRQRDYFQAISLGDLKAQGLTVDDTTTLASLIYTMLTGEIRKSDARKEI